MNNYVVIDTETSGLYVDTCEIIKLSALKIRNGAIAERFSSLIKPVAPLSEETERLAGIRNVDLFEKSGINDVLSDFINFIGNDTLVSHNIGFGIKFINSALKKAGMPSLKNETVDTLELARRKCKTDKFSLRSIAKFLEVNYKNLPDDEIVFYVYEKLKGMEDLSFPETCENKFYRDGKTFIKEIKSAEIKAKNDDGYDLYCKIRESGDGRFGYTVGSPFIKSYNKVLWLENSAFETVKSEIERYERERENIRNRHATFYAAKWEEYGISVYYEYGAPNSMQFNVYAEVNGIEFKIAKYASVESIFAMIKEFTDDENTVPPRGNIKKNPLYLSAVKYGDKRLIAELNFVYGAPSKEDLHILESVDGIKRLPELSEEYDRCFVLDYDEKTILTLKTSKYDFIHTSGFSMKGLTRSKLLINPHRKYVADAAKIDAPTMTFDEFLKLFDL